MHSIKGLVSKYPFGYYQKAKGVNVIDFNGQHLIDMSIMGVGACILGYADADVNDAVKKCIDDGSMSTYNCVEDEVLAKLLVDLHPWADKVRYARTGGEACAIAYELAFNYTKGGWLSSYGYHGWHLGTPWTENEFEFNNPESLEEAIDDFEPEIIFMEIMRHEYPTKEFIDTIKKVQKGRILIIDEITSGFRITNGGAHLEFGLEPDIAIFGKAMGNGYPITAVVGKKEVMESEAFISSTFWTERIGPVAGIATINKVIDKDVVGRLTELGLLLKEGLEELGLWVKPPWSLLQFGDIDVDTFQKRMLKKGYIARDSIYLSYAHNEEIINDYLKTVKEVLNK